jgi:hypothetical protein
VKIKENKPKRTLKEILGDRMIREVYPEIMSVMKEMGDVHTKSETNNVQLEFELYPERRGCRIILGYREKNNSSWFFGNNYWIMDEGKLSDKCLIASSDKYDLQTYISICDVAILVLENIRKTKLEFSKVLDKIDAIPVKFERKVITEKTTM